MVDRNLVRELLIGVREELLNERLAHLMSKTTAERSFAIDLAALLEAHLRGVIAIPDFGGAGRSGANDVGLVVLAASSAEHRADGTLKAPESWPPRTVAIELRDIRLTNAAEAPNGYEGALRELRADVTARARAKSTRGEESWLGLSLMTDGAWAGSPAKLAAEEVARDVRVARWRPCPEGLICIGSTSKSLAYREWSGHVWVEAFLPKSPEPFAALRSVVKLRPPAQFGSGPRESLAWYAAHGADGALFDGEGHTPAFLRVDATTLHEHRCDLYERAGAWGGTFEELRVCLYEEERIWRKNDDGSDFEGVPGVSHLVDELRATWSREETSPA